MWWMFCCLRVALGAHRTTPSIRWHFFTSLTRSQWGCRDIVHPCWYDFLSRRKLMLFLCPYHKGSLSFECNLHESLTGIKEGRNEQIMPRARPILLKIPVSNKYLTHWIAHLRISCICVILVEGGAERAFHSGNPKG